MGQYGEYRDTPVWRTVTAALAELEKNGSVIVNTAPEYVVGYVCQQLAVRRLLGPTAMEYDPQ